LSVVISLMVYGMPPIPYPDSCLPVNGIQSVRKGGVIVHQDPCLFLQPSTAVCQETRCGREFTLECNLVVARERAESFPIKCLNNFNHKSILKGIRNSKSACARNTLRHPEISWRALYSPAGPGP